MWLGFINGVIVGQAIMLGGIVFIGLRARKRPQSERARIQDVAKRAEGNLTDLADEALTTMFDTVRKVVETKVRNEVISSDEDFDCSQL